jgi:LAGLIDADG endonuclease
MTSLNVEEIPERIGNYLAGFADGEGSFNLSFRKRKDYSMPWKISLCFNVSQKDKVILALYEQYLKCGTLRGRHDGVWYYEVNNFTAIQENVIPFFDRFAFLSAKKQRDFAKFKQIAKLMAGRSHLDRDGIRQILAIRETMNDGGAGRRKYADAEILSLVNQENPQRLYAELDSDITGCRRSESR